MEKVRLSAIVLTKNEAKNLDRCFQSLKFCDQIIVIDDYSTDDSVEIAKKYGGGGHKGAAGFFSKTQVI